jgi:hypothetical protein
LRSTLSIPVAGTAACFDARPELARATGEFAIGVLGASLLLQRFAIPYAAKGIELVGPIGLLLALVAVSRGVLVFHRGRLALFALLTLWVVIGATRHAIYPNGYGITPLMSSLLQFLLLTGFCTLSFAQELDEDAFLKGAANILSIIAGAGIIQFVLQFAGVRVFAFTGLLPDRFLYEQLYNLQIPTGMGDVLKSNGFFLLEPSIFSQAMAMALIIEVLGARRLRHMTLFIIGLLLSFSGTGWIVLFSFLASVGARLGGRGFLIAAYVTASVIIMGAALLLISPDSAAVFTDRLSEFSQPGTSANMRFMTPFQYTYDILAHEHWAWLFGIGAGVSEKIDMAYDYNVNTPIKILLEFGLPAVLLYMSLFFTATRTRLQGALLVPSVVLVVFAGGYQEFAPVLFPIFLLVCVARLRPSGAFAT